MGPISTWFPNPAVKILEKRLWQKAAKRYLGEHPADAGDDALTVVEKVKSAYKDAVVAAVEEADEKVRGKWAEFTHVMTEEVKSALATVLHMSSVEWYSIEAGHLPNPEVIAVPYELLKHITEELLPQMLAKRIEFENLDDATLGALASYAVDRKFHDVLEHSMRSGEPFRIGTGFPHFVVAEIIKRDAYYLGEDRHHSSIDMVLLGKIGASSVNGERDNQRTALMRSLHQELRNRREERRFTGEGWEIEPEELKSWAAQT